ncbi:hypothetical protein Acf1_00028 [Acidovorax phage ACF1]|nr:hypothetical protein Acf1_00028 [Acidovorax phage ACF1]
MGSYHAVKSPSSAKRWGGREACTASIGAQRGIQASGGNPASWRGTCGHQMCEEMLLDESIDPQSYLGRTMVFEGSGVPFWEDTKATVDDVLGLEYEPPADRATIVVDQTLIDECMTHVGYVRERVLLTGGTLFVEQSVPIDHITGETGATGSADVGLVYGTTVEVIDLKLGRNLVEAFDVVVEAHEDIITGAYVPAEIEPYEQIAMYASGFMRKLDGLFDFRDVILTISQPPLAHMSQWSGTVAELNVVIDRLRVRSQECDTNPVFRPTNSNCHFCRASGNCAAQTKKVAELALEGFADEPAPRPVGDMELGQAFALLPMVYDWAKAIESRVYTKLYSGERVQRADGIGYKLVDGRKGAREWENEAEAEALMKKMRIKADAMYTRKLISPAAAEKLAKAPKAKKGETPLPPVLGPTQWNRLQACITQDKGKLAIALETDPRPAAPTAAAGFEDVPPADNSDLF